jgi:hypothetical protein
MSPVKRFVYLYGVDHDNGRIIVKINLGAPVFSTSCLTDNLLYVADFPGNISCFQVRYSRDPE